MLLSYRLIVIQLERCNERYGLYGSARRRRRNSAMGDGWWSSSGGANAVDRYYKYSTRVNLREPTVDPNEPEVKYVIRERYAAELCARVFCPIGGRQAVGDSVVARTTVMISLTQTLVLTKTSVSCSRA